MTRILSLDVGERRIGVAISDALGMTAQGVTVLERRSPDADLEALRKLASERGAETIVVGLPLTLKGERGAHAQRVMAFAQRLRHTLGLPVELVDERLTTVQGERALIETGSSRKKRKAVIDRVAAQLILQHYLDAKQIQRGS